MQTQPFVPARSCVIFPSGPGPMTAAPFPISGGAALVALAMVAALEGPLAPLAIVSCPDFAFGPSFVAFWVSWAETTPLIRMRAAATDIMTFRIVDLLVD
jgi:hypothetical protein